MYPTTFLLNLSSTTWEVKGIEPARAWSRKIDNPWVSVPGKFLGIGDSRFPVYSTITIPVLVWRSGPIRGMFGDLDFGITGSTDMCVSLNVDGGSTRLDQVLQRGFGS